MTTSPVAKQGYARMQRDIGIGLGADILGSGRGGFALRAGVALRRMEAEKLDFTLTNDGTPQLTSTEWTGRRLHARCGRRVACDEHHHHRRDGAQRHARDDVELRRAGRRTVKMRPWKYTLALPSVRRCLAALLPLISTWTANCATASKSGCYSTSSPCVSAKFSVTTTRGRRLVSVHAGADQRRRGGHYQRL